MKLTKAQREAAERRIAEREAANARTQPIHDWLADRHAVALAQFGDGGSRIHYRVYSVAGRVFLVGYHDEGGGWDVYVPVTDNGSIAVTLDALNKWLAGDR